MNNVRLGERFLLGAAAMAAMIMGVVLSGQPASAARVAGDADPPQAFLLRLDPASTVRVFQRNRDEGAAVARSAARGQKATIGRAQAKVIDELPADAEVLYRTHTLLAGVGVSAAAGDQHRLEDIPGVKAVYPIAPKRIENSYAVPLQAAPAAWQSTGFLGQGETIAVIDTGVDYTHADFGGPGTKEAYEEAHENGGQPSDPSVFPNEKVIGGIDLVGDSYDPDPDSPTYQPDPQPDPYPLDCDGHGSHVAGSAAGYGVGADGTTYDGSYDESTDFEAMKIGPGMAPKAGIFAIRVFGCQGSTTVVTEAIDRAVDPNGDGDPSDHVDVINMSLGSDYGSVQDGDSIAANAAVEMGVNVVAAAGNAGDRTDVSGSPGDASRVLSVANSVDAASRVDGARVTIDGSQQSFGVTRSVLYDWKANPDLNGTVVAAPAGNETACEPYPEGTFNGEVVLVAWHDAVPECASVTRGENLAAAGAGGFIFASDSETFSAGINGSDTIPGVLMAASGAEAIRDALDDELEVTVDGTEINSVTQTFPEDNDKVATSSSRGIHATGNVKPDVTAVGTSVFSVQVGSGSDGTSLTGTSMASPMVAGLAALVRQAHPAWSPLRVKAGIMNTAGHDLYVGGPAEPSSDRYGAPRVGAGRIDAADAVANRVLAYDAENGAVSVSFGPVEAEAPTTLDRQVTVENLSSMPVTYDASYDPINEVPGAEFTVTPSQVSLGPGDQARLTVHLKIEPSELTKAVDPTIGRFDSVGQYPRETLAEAFGRLLLEPAGTGTTLRVPVYASPRPASSMTQPDALEIHRTASTAGDPSQTASFELSGHGVGTAAGTNGEGDGDPDNDIFSIAAGFELQARSGESPQCDDAIRIACWRLPEEKDADLKLVGYTSDAPLLDDPNQSLGYFAFAMQEPWAIPANKVAIQVDFDTDRDGTPDLFLYNGRLRDDDVFVSILLDPAKPEDERVVDVQLVNGRFGDLDTALYDSDVMVLPVSLGALADYGIDAEHPRVSYGIETYSGFSAQPIDLLGLNPETGALKDPLSANLFEPGIMVTDAGGNGPLLFDAPGRSLNLNRNVASYQADSGQGLMMVHFHNRAGEKAQVVSLTGAASATEVAVAPSTISARVEAAGTDLPAPSGEVSFSVDGKRVGSAPLKGGTASLNYVVPSGATRQVEAEYAGDADFESSSAQVQRMDPELTARATSRLRRNRFGWYRTAVRVAFTCTTHGAELLNGCPNPRRLIRDGRGQTAKDSIMAADGGRASARVTGIKIDRTKPRVRIRGVRRGATYHRVRRARCVARDRTSGVLRCRLKRKRRGHRVIYRAVAVDRAGNRRAVRLWTRLRR